MPLLYAVISRGPTVLAKYAECVGNFAEVTEQVINKIQLEDHKLTYSHGSYLIHYICEGRVVYMCITDDVSYLLFLNFNQRKKRRSRKKNLGGNESLIKKRFFLLVRHSFPLTAVEE